MPKMVEWNAEPDTEVQSQVAGHEILSQSFAKASETEIFTRVRRRYLTSFAGLHFEN